MRATLSAVILRDGNAEKPHFRHLRDGVIRNQLVASLPLQPARRDGLVDEVMNRPVERLLLLAYQPLEIVIQAPLHN